MTKSAENESKRKTTAQTAFSQQLKQWRGHRNYSQLELSLSSGVSQRHISFLESGRASPSREMILKLSIVLDIPLRQQNRLLSAAGFAPIHSERELSDPELAPIRRAVDYMLRQQEPYPALVMDRYWNQIQVNDGTKTLLGWLLNGRPIPDSVGPNLMKLMLHPEGVRSHVVDWPTLVPNLLHRVHRESLSAEAEPTSRELFEELLTYPDVRSLWQSPFEPTWHQPLLTVTFRVNNQQLSFFTTLTTLGTPQDITLQELRIESMFPADQSTEKLFRAL